MTKAIPVERSGACDRRSRCRSRSWLGVVALCLWSIALGATPARAMRIVSLAPSVTETLFALGAGADVVGVSSYCDYPPEAVGIDKVGTFLTPNAEVILAKQPDLVIAVPSPGNRSPVEALERIGLKVLVVDPETIAGIEQSVETIATAIGREEAGRELVSRIRAGLNQTRARLAGVSPRRTLMVVGHSPLVAVGGGVYLGELIEMAGGTNIAAQAGGPWPHLSLEFVLAQAPEVIIDTAMGSEESAGQGDAFWQTFTTLPAVRDRRVSGYREYALLRPGPRVVEALGAMARFIHPERFDQKAGEGVL